MPRYRKLYFLGGSIVFHLVLFYFLATEYKIFKFAENEDQTEIFLFRMTNPVIQTDPIIEQPKPPPEQLDSRVVLVEKKEDEQLSSAQDTYDFPETKEYQAFYKVDTKPSFLVRASLQYPLIEKKRGNEGVVILEGDIDQYGQLDTVRIIRSAGENFDKAAISMLRNSTFLAGQQDGEPVSVRMRFSIRFKLDDS